MNIFIGELIGTMILVLLGDGVVANVLLEKTKGHNSGWIVIAAGWGFAVAIAVYIAGWASGAHINPAVTFGLAAIGELPSQQIPVYLAGQFLGAFLGAVLVFGIGLSLGGPTGYAINPARDLAPRLAHALLPIAGKGKSDWSYSWVPVVGPILGGILGAWLYHGLMANLTPLATP